MPLWLFHVAAIEVILLLPNARAQETETSVQPVVVAAPEPGPTNASAVDPDVPGLTGRTEVDGNIEALRIAATFDWARVTLITSWRQWELGPYIADFDYSAAHRGWEI